MKMKILVCRRKFKEVKDLKWISNLRNQELGKLDIMSWVALLVKALSEK